MSTHRELTDEILLALQLLIADGVLTNERIAREVGLNVVDLQTFGVIMRSPEPMTPGEVGAATLLPSSSTTRVLDRLERRGFVRRAHDGEDRRRVRVTANVALAMSELGPHYAPIVENTQAAHAAFSADELAVVLRYLRAIGG